MTRPFESAIQILDAASRRPLPPPLPPPPPPLAPFRPPPSTSPSPLEMASATISATCDPAGLSPPTNRKVWSLSALPVALHADSSAATATAAVPWTSSE